MDDSTEQGLAAKIGMFVSITEASFANKIYTFKYHAAEHICWAWDARDRIILNVLDRNLFLNSDSR